MRELFEKVGFTLKDFPDGKFWILQKHEELFIQANQDFTNITLYDHGWVENNLTLEELNKALEHFAKDEELGYDN